MNRRNLIVRGLSAAGAALLTACFGRGRSAEMERRDGMQAVANSEKTEVAMRDLMTVLSPQEHHWVGDGFYVSTVFSPFHLDPEIFSPFILMDHAAPRHFEPSDHRRGVGEHPHRGFETVTFALEGEIEHRDSHGGGGKIGAGDVQWMTAASGVVHEEFHSRDFARQGGMFEMVQLWVNLPARLKMTKPRYQAIQGKAFPKVNVGEGASARLVAGEFLGAKGPALTYSPITIFDLDIAKGQAATFTLPKGMTTLIFALKGEAKAQGHADIGSRDLMVFDAKSSGDIHLQSDSGARFLVLAGEPFGEPVVAHGPFVMNSREEIVQAIRDYQMGKMGQLVEEQS